MSLKHLIKKSIFSFIALLPAPQNSASILMYHSLGDNKAFFTTPPDMFERHVRYLKEKRYTVIGISSLVQKIINKQDLSKTVTLTFDDGYEDLYRVLFPLLKKYAVPATIFLPTGLIGKAMTTSDGVSFFILTLAQIKEMKESGLVEFMPHTKHHQLLDRIPLKEAEQEIAESSRDIRDLLGGDANVLAYPEGKYTSDIVKLVKRLGFIAAVTVRGGVVSSTSHLFELSRNAIDSSTSWLEFTVKASGRIAYYESLKKRINRV